MLGSKQASETCYELVLEIIDIDMLGIDVPILPIDFGIAFLSCWRTLTTRADLRSWLSGSLCKSHRCLQIYGPRSELNAGGVRLTSEIYHRPLLIRFLSDDGNVPFLWLSPLLMSKKAVLHLIQPVT